MDAVKDFLAKAALFLAKGKLVMWIYTINMVVLSWYATANNWKIDSSVAIMYGSALTAYVGSKGYETHLQSKVTKKMEPDDV